MDDDEALQVAALRGAVEQGVVAVEDRSIGACVMTSVSGSAASLKPGSAKRS